MTYLFISPPIVEFYGVVELRATYLQIYYLQMKGEHIHVKRCDQLFFVNKGFIVTYTMRLKGCFPDALCLCCKYIGIPTSLTADPPRGQPSKQVKKVCNQIDNSLRLLE